MSKRPVQNHLFHVLTLSLVILLAGGGIALLYQWHLGNTSSYASSDYVVGPPSLPAATVDTIFRQMGSPMVGTGQAVETASRAQNIDDAFALAVWWTETNDGAAGVGLADRNPGSVRGSIGYPSAYDGYTIYPSYSAAVSYWFMMLKKVYINRGLTTVSAISHPYVGTSTSNLWAGKVITLMQRYRGEAPPAPTPTPKPTIAPDIKRQGQQLGQEQQQRGQAKSTYYAPAPQVTQHAPTISATTTHGLSATTRTELVLFDLLLALALALWAWSVNRRYANRPQPVQTPPVAANPWEQMRASGQQPASFFNGFSGPLRTTDNLVPGLRTTETLATTTSASPNSNQSESLLSLGAFLAGQAPFQSTEIPQLQPDASWLDQSRSAQAWFDQQGSPADAPTTDYAQATPFPRSNLTGLSRSAQSPLHRTRLQPTGDSTGPQPISIGTSGGLLSRYREMQTQNEQEA